MEVNIDHFHWHWGLPLEQLSWIASGPKSNFICDDIPTKAILFFFGCLEVNNTCLIPPSQPISAREKYYSLVWYVLKEVICYFFKHNYAKLEKKNSVIIYFHFFLFAPRHYPALSTQTCETFHFAGKVLIKQAYFKNYN